jgi:hypothetical protein
MLGVTSVSGTQMGVEASYGNQAAIPKPWDRLEKVMALHNPRSHQRAGKIRKSLRPNADTTIRLLFDAKQNCGVTFLKATCSSREGWRGKNSPTDRRHQRARACIGLGIEIRSAGQKFCRDSENICLFMLTEPLQMTAIINERMLYHRGADNFPMFVL